MLLLLLLLIMYVIWFVLKVGNNTYLYELYNKWEEFIKFKKIKRKTEYS